MRRNILTCAAAALALSASLCSAQSKPPSAPAPKPDAIQAKPTGPNFPPVPPGNFTAAQPTKAQVDAFLKTSWGYDPNRKWEVYGIQKTKAPGVSKVEVLLGETPSPKLASLIFFVTPDGKHLITQDSVIDFGADPYAGNRRVLQQSANGPWKGSASKQFLLVEFADFQCPHCKDAQPVVQKLLHDFPQARYVYQFFPLLAIHPEAFASAAYGECVQHLGGNAAFFKYADAIFTNQDQLDGSGADAALKSAASAAGVDPARAATCAASPETAKEVHASLQLGENLGVDETPTLFIDGRRIPMLAVPYPQLKKIVEWQFSLDKSQPAAASK